ncbi:t-SNARE affecting a late Golgi compartment protein 2 [Dictyocoela muelleri]|nr:t-SNARE affecting a late Golgi compartment protein 2 [Dictyocoela muelleri]
MLIDRTADYRKFKKTKIHYNHDLTPNRIRRQLKELTEEINMLKTLQVRQTLPSFSHRREKKNEIMEIKTEIDLKLVKVENEIKSIAIPAIKNYFIKKLQAILLEYRKNQQEYLKNIKNVQIFDELENIEGNEIMICTSKQKRIDDVRKSIFFITTVLMEIKSLVLQQNESIDRIDFNLEISNNNLNLASKEMRKIGKSRGLYKNRIIVFLISVLVILLCISSGKIIRRRKIVRDRILADILTKL